MLWKILDPLDEDIVSVPTILSRLKHAEHLPKSKITTVYIDEFLLSAIEEYERRFFKILKIGRIIENPADFTQ